MLFELDEIKKYLESQRDLKEAIINLNEDNILMVTPIDYSHPKNKTEENLFKYEKQIGMLHIKENARRTFNNTDGREGKYWMACSPKWKQWDSSLKTDFEIVYWVNYGDNQTYGYFTVEQIKEWLTTPGLKLHTIGGTKER